MIWAGDRCEDVDGKDEHIYIVVGCALEGLRSYPPTRTRLLPGADPVLGHGHMSVKEKCYKGEKILRRTICRFGEVVACHG